jgi:BCCT family betaine/carnitine transporter
VSLLLIALGIVIVFCILIFTFPDLLAGMFTAVTGVFGNYFIILSFIGVVVLVFVAFSRHGKIKLGEGKPRFKFFTWISMVFTTGLAGDLVFFGFHEFKYYADQTTALGTDNITNMTTYSILHWTTIPWVIYFLPAVAYAYFMHVRGNKSDKISAEISNHKKLSNTIDVISLVTLIVGCATTFSITTPYVTHTLNLLFSIPDSVIVSIVVIVIIAVVYMLASVFGITVIARIATGCVVLYIVLLAAVFILGDTLSIIKYTASGLSTYVINFVKMSTWLDIDNVSNGFKSDWTVFFFAYWISWSVLVPKWIGQISEGMTIRKMLIGGVLAGSAATGLAFFVFGNNGVSSYLKGAVDIGADPNDVINHVLQSLPGGLALIFILVVLILMFYITSFDSIVEVLSSFINNHTTKGKVLCSVILVILPLTLVFNSVVLDGLKSLTIIMAVPMSLILILVVVTFMRMLRKDDPVTMEQIPPPSAENHHR